MFIKALKRTHQIPNRSFATLILAEHFEGKLNMSIGACLKAAQELKDNHVSSNNR
jgi:hypothetical protein